jgi:DNA-binding response OmpR family regulator
MPIHSFLEFRILLADADPVARAAYADALCARGLEIDQVATEQDALQCLHARQYAVLVLDPFRLGMNERELLSRARALDDALALIIVTAHPTIDSTIAAIRANVFDYLIKPCGEAEVAQACERALQARTRQARQERVLAMVRSVLSELDGGGEALMPEAESAPASENGWLRLDKEKRVVTLQTAPPVAVELTEGEVALLSALMEKPNHVLTCAQLAQVALGYNGMDKWTVESVIRSSIFRLRQKLEPSPDAPKLIHTVRGRGYYFAVTS